MSGPKIDSTAFDAETEITLGLLNAVEENSAVTQRSVAKELGIALGLTNAYLKRCIKKGFIKVTQAPANRYIYYLTPQGFAEKSRLTARYLSISFNFFREARRECAAVFETCAARGWTCVALCGVSDLVEIATLCVDETGVELVGIVDPEAHMARFAELPVYADLDATGPVDAVIVTNLANPQAAFELMAGSLPPERVLAPGFLNVSRGHQKLME